MRLLVRWWHVVLVGLVLLLLAFGYVRSQPPVYWGERHVLLLEPGVSHSQGVWEVPSDRLTGLAAAVEHQSNEGQPVTRLNSNDAKLFAVGFSATYQVRLFNRGTQWNYSFPAPLLIIEAVGSSPEQVTALQDEATARIQEWVAALQSQGGVPPASQATVMTRDLDPPAMVGPSSAGKVRAAIGATLLVVGAMAAISFELRRRRSHSSARGRGDEHALTMSQTNDRGQESMLELV